MISLRVFNDSDVAYDRVAHGPQVGSKGIARFHDLMIFPRVFYRSASLPGWAVGSFQGGHLSVECMPLCRLTSWWFSLGIFIKRWSWFHDLMISPRVFDRFVIGLPVALEDCTAFPIWWFSIGFFIILQGLNALDGVPGHLEDCAGFPISWFPHDLMFHIYTCGITSMHMEVRVRFPYW